MRNAHVVFVSVIFKKIFCILDLFECIYFDYEARVPVLNFNPKQMCDVTVSLGITQGETFGSSTITSDLLRTYCRIDERVRLLGIAFRYWAHV